MVFNNGICIQFGFYDRGSATSGWSATINLPVSYESFYSCLVCTHAQGQVNLCTQNKTLSCFELHATPDYGCSYSQRYSHWITIGY